MKLLDDDEYEKRKIEIFELVKQIKNNEIVSIHLNNTLVNYSSEILKTLGKPCDVNSRISNRNKFRLGNCFPNSTRKMLDNKWSYVEGVCINKIDESLISHAWNIDTVGNHCDVTYRNSSDFEYVGIVVPMELVWEIGKKNGFTWYCTLPFLTP